MIDLNNNQLSEQTLNQIAGICNNAVMKFRLYLLFLFVAIFHGDQQAEECHGFNEHKWTLAELLNTALSNNPETRITWWNAERAAASLGSAKSAYYPQIALNANVQHGHEFQFIGGPDVNFTTLRADIIFTFLLADFGERAANVQAQMKALEAAGWQSDWAIQKVMAKVFENSYATIAAQDTLEALRLSLQDAKKMLDTSTDLNRAGLSPISDVYSSKAALAQIEIEVAQQKAQLDIQRANLATTLGLDIETPLSLYPIEALTIPSDKLCELIFLARETRQDLMAKRARVAEAIARKAKTAAQYNPKITFNGRGGADHTIHDNASAAQFQIGLNFDMPLFTGFDDIYQNRMALADVKISEQELLQLELDISLEVFSQSRLVESTKVMLQYAKENFDNARKAFEGALEKYHAGKERIAEVSIALRQIINARVRYSEIHSKHLIAVANLAFATGTLGSSMEFSCIKK